MVCALVFGFVLTGYCEAQEQPPLPIETPSNPLRAEEIPTPLPNATLGSIQGPLSNPPDSQMHDEFGSMDSILEGGPPSPVQELMAPPPQPRRSIRVNPMAVPQGAAHLAFDDPEPLSGQRLGFPFSLVPDRLYNRLPTIKFDLGMPDQRSMGKGNPLQTTSWRNRPYHFDVFSGGYFHGSVIPGLQKPEGTTVIGGRIGWDHSHYFGSELRFGTAEANLAEIQSKLRTRMSDISWQYYPWGDSQIRPYTSIGIGIVDYEYNDAFNVGHGATTMSLPIAIGIKHYVRHWVSFRLEFEDNITFSSSQFNSGNNLSVTGSIEFRFGGRRKTYYPFNPSRSFF